MKNINTEKPHPALKSPDLKIVSDRESTEKEASYMLVLFFLFPQYPFVATVKVQVLGSGTFDLTQDRCSCETGISVGCPRGEVCSSPPELPSSRSPCRAVSMCMHHYLACSMPCPPLPCLCSVHFLPDVCMNCMLA